MRRWQPTVRILTRYVIGDLLTVFLLTLAGMTTLIFVAMIGKEAVDKGLGLGPLVRMTPYLLPQAMQFAVPGTMLLAVTSVYGRMASSNEIVAVKSMGISPWALAMPTLVLAALVSFGAVLLNDVAVSWGRLGVERVFVESIEEVIYGQLRVHRTYRDGNLNITVRRVEGRKLIEPTLTGFFGDSQEPTVGAADWAELEKLPGRHEVVIRLHNLELAIDDGGVVLPTTTEGAFSLDKLAGRNGGRSPSTYALAEIGEAITRTSTDIEQLRQDQTARAAMAMMTGEMELLSEAGWAPLDQSLRSAAYTRSRLHAEPHRRWATGFSCLAFVAVGIPVSIIMRKGEFLASFFMCFAPILIVYYPLLMVSVDKAKGGAVPPASVWVGNAVLALSGSYLMRRVIRY
ncbi:MAG: LptF/LptG family permease [Planctomycetota bacterium]